MAVEVLHLFVRDDDSDSILKRNIVSGGEKMVSDFLDYSQVMLLVAKDETNAGILVQRPESIDAFLYMNDEDMDGVFVGNQKIIQLKPGQELRIAEPFGPKEFWFVHKGNESQITLSPMESPVAV
jgi:hypothetical protein